ncbi:22608_t:CDS:2, partial [Racocetra persica]
RQVDSNLNEKSAKLKKLELTETERHLVLSRSRETEFGNPFT